MGEVGETNCQVMSWNKQEGRVLVLVEGAWLELGGSTPGTGGLSAGGCWC